MNDSDEEDGLFRRRSPTKGKLCKGAVLKNSSAQSSIPTKSEIEGTRSVPQHAASKQAFSTRSHRFAPSKELEELKNVPGPGSYAPSESNAQELSLSKKGMGNGFVSSTTRFPASAPATTRAPGPGQYYDAKKQSSINLSPARQRAELSTPPPHAPSPGPGFYDPQLQRSPSPNKHGSSAFLDSSQRVKTFAPEPDSHTQKMGPGKYNPRDPTRARSSVASPFKSHTKREVDFGKSETPGPGTYTEDSDEEKEAHVKPKPLPPGKLLSKSLVHSTSSMYSRASASRNIAPDSPGPGQYHKTYGRDARTSLEPHRPSPSAPPHLRRHSIPNPPASSFASRTQRMPLQTSTSIRERVGPGAYNTDSPMKTSFHANRKDEWLG